MIVGICITAGGSLSKKDWGNYTPLIGIAKL
jgi:hypothetical protein